MFYRRSLISLAALLLSAALLAAPAAAMDAKLASAHVQSLGAKAFAALQRGDMSLAQREAAFAAILQEGFALELIGRFVLGKYWRDATAEQRAEYQRLFGRFVVKTYAARLGGVAGASFKITQVTPVGDSDVLVGTRIDRPVGAPLVAGWRVRVIDGRYKIIDVVVEGVSMAATQRQEFAAVVQSRGVDGLLQILMARTQTLAASG